LTNIVDFSAFPKIPRLKRGIVMTEKIDGTNAQIVISADGTEIRAGSRNRWITPEDDNFGFAKWVQANRDELLQLGPGQHFGEWWGLGIRRNYGLTDKRWSLFNTGRWSNDRPACCGVVPVLYAGPFDTAEVDRVLSELREYGSRAAPGWMKPEGVVIYHSATNTLTKQTLDDDDLPKSIVQREPALEITPAGADYLAENDIREAA
jgi:hypothetical protein